MSVSRRKRDSNYYYGLFFLLLSATSIIWCIAKENFNLGDFMIFLIFFTWGFGLLWKSDIVTKFQDVETRAGEEIAALQARLSTLEQALAVDETEEFEGENELRQIDGCDAEGVCCCGCESESDVCGCESDGCGCDSDHSDCGCCGPSEPAGGGEEADPGSQFRE